MASPASAPAAPASSGSSPASAAANAPSEKRHFNPWLTLVIVCVAQFMVVLDATIVNVALPSIQKGLHFSRADLQWVINGYTLLFGGFLLLGGRAADLLGRRRLFTAGITLFSLASAVNAFAQSSNVLIAGRALQGLGAALVSPAALSILTTTFTDPAERTKALGVWSGIAAGGAAVGPADGRRAHRPALLALGVHRQPARRRRRAARRPALRARVARPRAAQNIRPRRRLLGHLPGSSSPSTGSSRRSSTAGAPGARSAPLAVAAVLLGAFFAIEKRSPAPLVRLSILRIRTLAAANLSLLFVMSGMMSMFYFASLYVQQVLGYSPLKAGLAFLPVTVCIGIGAALAQSLIRRFGRTRDRRRWAEPRRRRHGAAAAHHRPRQLPGAAARRACPTRARHGAHVRPDHAARHRQRARR